MASDSWWFANAACSAQSGGSPASSYQKRSYCDSAFAYSTAVFRSKRPLAAT